MNVFRVAYFNGLPTEVEGVTIATCIVDKDTYKVVSGHSRAGYKPTIVGDYDKALGALSELPFDGLFGRVDSTGAKQFSKFSADSKLFLQKTLKDKADAAGFTEAQAKVLFPVLQDMDPKQVDAYSGDDPISRLSDYRAKDTGKWLKKHQDADLQAKLVDANPKWFSTGGTSDH